MSTLTHRQLCDLAVNWLQRPASRSGPGCQVAFSESRGAWSGETPDAIGFRAAVYRECSVLVEVKVSRADFLADRKKPHRIDPGLGMGVYRYFMAPAGMINVDELPSRWGLIEVSPKGAPKVVAGHVLLKYRDEDVWAHERTIEREWTLLTRMLNRVGDVEKAQNSLKESRNINARLIKETEQLRKRVQELELEQIRHRHLQGDKSIAAPSVHKRISNSAAISGVAEPVSQAPIS